MTDESAANAPSPRPKPKTSRKVKLVFLLVILAGLGVWYYWSIRGTMLNWPGDFAAAQRQAQQENKKLVVFVRGFPASDLDSRMAQTTLSKALNQKALKEYVLCEINLDRSAPWARKYGLDNAAATPIMLVISPDGKTFHRQDGMIGEEDFRLKFLAAPLEQKARE